MIRPQADADLDPAVVIGVRRREPGVDFQDWRGFIPQAMKDPEVLALAAASGRILVSHDLGTMPRHFAEFVSRHDSPGLIRVPQRTAIRRIIDDLVLLWAASEESEWRNGILYLPL